LARFIAGAADFDARFAPVVERRAVAPLPPLLAPVLLAARLPVLLLARPVLLLAPLLLLLLALLRAPARFDRA
jgi:hypothetical protein